MDDDKQKELCKCDPVSSPDHYEDAHDDEKDGPGVVDWKNPLHNAPESADYDDTLNNHEGPGVTSITPKPEVGPGV